VFAPLKVFNSVIEKFQFHPQGSQSMESPASM
jgi:hypothetical protein